MTDPLPDNWTPSEYRQLDRAWAEHPQHDLLAELADEHDGDGYRTWQLVRLPEPADPTWTAHYLRPRDPRDPRPAICITRYPRQMPDATNTGARSPGDEQANH